MPKLQLRTRSVYAAKLGNEAGMVASVDRAGRRWLPPGIIIGRLRAYLPLFFAAIYSVTK